VEAGKWYFIVGTYNGSTLNISVNGIEKSATATGTSTDGGSPFYIGSRHNATDNYFDGLIQNAGALSVALTSSQRKKLWAYTTYKGQKIRRATSDGNLYQTLDEALVERLRGKTVTMRATMWQDTASIGQININDGSDNKSTTTATTGSWVTVSTTATISSTATAITLKLEANTSDGNVWFKEVAFYEGSGVAPYSHSQDDWNKFPNLLRLNNLDTIFGYKNDQIEIKGASRVVGYALNDGGDYAFQIPIVFQKPFTSTPTITLTQTSAITNTGTLSATGASTNGFSLRVPRNVASEGIAGATISWYAKI
jgi:hypothetical protein